MTDFNLFKTAVAAQFQKMSKHSLYRADVTGQEVWDAYLGAFPEGTDPLYRQRTEHDCSSCKSFIRAIGNCVAIIDGKAVSLWDIKVSEPTYQTVADALAAIVYSKKIDNLFYHFEPRAGLDKNFEEITGNVKTYSHFFVNIPSTLVVKSADVGTKTADARATHDVFLRGLTEISLPSIETVLELVGQNSIYRGTEHKNSLEQLKKLKKEFVLLDEVAQDTFVWSKVNTVIGAITRIRNTSIGTLLTDISEGKDLDIAVSAFEKMVAPANYKRPTAVVTKDMIQKAQAEIEKLGLMSALGRRHAVIGDITVDNVLHANRAARTKMAESTVFDDIASSLPEKTKDYSKVEEVTIENFLANVLPRAESVEVLLENRLAPSLVSLIAPSDPTAGLLFKWNNNFTWDYAGGYADSVKERVKKAGGSVTGDLCCRLGWFNTDDLDLRMTEPGGCRIYFGNKRSYVTHGCLDVDMNVTHPVRNPVENIFYSRRDTMVEGVYQLEVNQYKKREASDMGFEVEIDYMGNVQRFTYDKAMRSSQTVLVAEFKYTHKNGMEIIKSLEGSEVSRTLWGLPTQSFHKVSVMMHSPNYWDGQGVGNKHYFFMLEGAQREDAVRGFYNEFLKGDLDVHRKAFEMVGSRMKSEGTADQLSGVGFSSTQKNHVVVRVKGATSRVMKLII